MRGRKRCYAIHVHGVSIVREKLGCDKGGEAHETKRLDEIGPSAPFLRGQTLYEFHVAFIRNAGSLLGQGIGCLEDRCPHIHHIQVPLRFELGQKSVCAEL